MLEQSVSASAPASAPLDQRAVRDIPGRFTTGVVLVTAQAEHGPVGMAVNSSTSVSLEPPLVALCAGRSSTTWHGVRAAGRFAVSILGEGHAELCRLFSEREADRFSGRERAYTRAGHPVPAGVLGRLDCEISVIHPAGDHELVVASATEGALAGATAPPVFHAGRFRGLAA